LQRRRFELLGIGSVGAREGRQLVFSERRCGEHPDRQIAVIIPDLVERHWYHYLLHNQEGEMLKALLQLRGHERVVIIGVPWYLHT
jgi:hypothetical protein